MNRVRRYTLTSALVAAVVLVHGLLTWPLGDLLALYVAGMIVAFLGEAAVIRPGLLEHRMRPRVAGVPIVVLAAWPATVYVVYGIALLVAPAGVQAALLAAVLGTLADVLVDPPAVADGIWAYPEHELSSPRFRGVPWWNFAGWFANVFVIAMVPTLLA